MAANALSTSSSLRACRTRMGCPTAWAAASTWRRCSGVAWFSGPTRKAIRPGCGRTSRSNSRRFGFNSAPKAYTPVALPRPAEAGDEAQLHRVEADAEHDRDGCGRLFRRRCLAHPGRDEQRHRNADQLVRERRQTIQVSLGVSVLDRNILADDKARLFQSL